MKYDVFISTYQQKELDCFASVRKENFQIIESVIFDCDCMD